jgi:hypothetical protein
MRPPLPENFWFFTLVVGVGGGVIVTAIGMTIVWFIAEMMGPP